MKTVGDNTYVRIATGPEFDGKTAWIGLANIVADIRNAAEVGESDRHRNGGAGEHSGFAKSACVIRRNKTAFQYHTFCVICSCTVFSEGCMEVIDQLRAVLSAKCSRLD